MLKFTKVALIIIAVLLVLYVIALVVAGISPTVNDADLRVTRDTLAPGEDGCVIIQTAATSIWWPDEKNQELLDLVSETNWNVSLATQVVATNQSALAAIDAALTTPGFQCVELVLNDRMPGLANTKRLSQVAAIQANVLFRQGKEQQAFEQALKIVQLGKRLQESKGPIIYYLVGSAVQGQGLALMRRWTGRTHLSPAQLSEIAQRLNSCNDDGSALTLSLKAEYQGYIQSLADIRAGKIRDPINDPVIGRLIKMKFAPVFNMGKTKLLFANATRQLIAGVSRPYCDFKRPGFTANRPSPVKLIFSGNVGGQVFFYMTIPFVEAAIENKSSKEAQFEATRAILALRAYQMKHGKLPDDLATLAPEFLDAVPMDAFTGKPLRYVPERKLVYSVGENLRDDNGEKQDSQSWRTPYPLDYPFAFDF